MDSTFYTCLPKGIMPTELLGSKPFYHGANTLVEFSTKALYYNKSLYQSNKLSLHWCNYGMKTIFFGRAFNGNLIIYTYTGPYQYC